MLRKFRFVFIQYNEAIFWSMSFLVIFFFVNPAVSQVSFCVFHWLGWENCWGCGIARSMHQALHGRFAASWNLHKMGIPAVFILGSRILSLISRQKPHYEQLPDVIARSAARGNGGNQGTHQ